MPGSPFPPLGPRGSGSPPSSVLWLAPNSRALSRRTSFPSLGGTTMHHLAMQARSDAPLPARTSSGPRTVHSRGGLEILPGSWGVLVCMPCSRTPARPTVPGHLSTVDVAFRYDNDVGPHGYYVLGAESHGLHTGCLRFAARVTPTPRKTRFWLAALPWPDGFCPRGTPVEVSVFHHSLPPSFSWRNVANS